MSADREEQCDRDEFAPTDLRVEFESAPSNVDPGTAPHFGWRVDTADRGASQTSYQILVARDRDSLATDAGTCWDSGKVLTERCSAIEYDGAPLASDETYYWKVRLWNERGEPSSFSPVASFSTALADATDWAGEWISHQPGAGDTNGYRSRWRRPDEEPTEWVQIDLGRPREIADIILYPTTPFDGPETPEGVPVSALHSEDRSDAPPHTRDGADGFGFPRRYRVEGAETREFDDPVTIVEDRRCSNPGSSAVRHSVSEDEIRHIRVVAESLYEFDPAVAAQTGGNDLNLDEENAYGPSQYKTDLMTEEVSSWQVFALAGIAVQNEEGRDLAAGRPVTASSSIEETTWGREHLVNGTYRSVTAASSPLFRETIELSKPVERARAHFVGLGYGELYVNGERVGDRVLDPAWTDYDERVLYSTYDVTDDLRQGANVLGIWLGRGRFSQNFYDWTGFGSPRARLHLTVEYADGTTKTIGTTGNWRATASPIVANDIYDGETYDARTYRNGWVTPGFDDHDWASAVVVPGPGGTLEPQRIDPIRVVETRSPVTVDDHPDGPILDFGQNLTGWLELTVRDPDGDERISLVHAEELHPDGSLDRRTLRTADATDTYITRGDERETYQPRFTYHGFRYAQVRGYPGDLNSDDVVAKVVHTDVDSTCEFDCSNDVLQAVHRAAQWSLRGNLHGLPTDCPQRDERFGWTGDGRITARACTYSFDVQKLHRKWMRDHDDAQRPGGYLPDTVPHGPGSIPSDPSWTVTRVSIPWQLYRHYGDTAVLRDHYEEMRRYVDYWHSVADDGIVPTEYANYGDWLALEHTDEDADVLGKPKSLFATAAHYESTDRFADIAAAIGFNEEAATYRRRAETISMAFNDRFFVEEEGQYEPRTQAAQAVPLQLGIVPDGFERSVIETLSGKIRDEDGGKLQTGFLGTPALIDALTETDHEQLAYHLITQPEYPGWVHMIHNGATTLWEDWNAKANLSLSSDTAGVRADVVSLNHPQYAFVSAWYIRVIAGLRVESGNQVTIAPTLVDDLDRARGAVDTRTGRLSCSWKRREEQTTIDITVPWNTSATVVIPAEADECSLEIDGEPVDLDPEASHHPGIESVGCGEDGLTVSVTAGSYRVKIADRY